MTVSLRGLAWDHRRCWGPLDASVAPYQAAHPDVAIHWDRRSLYDFGEGRIEDVLRSYDLVIFDHPFVGDVARDLFGLKPDRILVGQFVAGEHALEHASRGKRLRRAE